MDKDDLDNNHYIGILRMIHKKSGIVSLVAMETEEGQYRGSIKVHHPGHVSVSKVI